MRRPHRGRIAGRLPDSALLQCEAADAEAFESAPHDRECVHCLVVDHGHRSAAIEINGLAVANGGCGGGAGNNVGADGQQSAANWTG
jgi:hypothetical protein